MENRLQIGIADIMGDEAKLIYGDASFKIKEMGDFVRCALTGVPIPLEELKYWNVERQEAYVDAIASLYRHREFKAQLRKKP